MPPPNVQHASASQTFTSTHSDSTQKADSQAGSTGAADASRAISSIQSEFRGQTIPGHRSLCDAPNNRECDHLSPGSALVQQIQARFADCLSQDGQANRFMLSFHSPKGHRLCKAHLDQAQANKASANGGQAVSEQSAKPSVLEHCLRAKSMRQLVQVELQGVRYWVNVKQAQGASIDRSANSVVPHLAGQYVLTPIDPASGKQPIRLKFLELAPPFDGRSLSPEALLECAGKIAALFPKPGQTSTDFSAQFSSAMGVGRAPALLIINQFATLLATNPQAKLDAQDVQLTVDNLIKTAREQSGKKALIPNRQMRDNLIVACTRLLNTFQDLKDNGDNQAQANAVESQNTEATQGNRSETKKSETPEKPRSVATNPTTENTQAQDTAPALAQDTAQAQAPAQAQAQAPAPAQGAPSAEASESTSTNNSQKASMTEILDSLTNFWNTLSSAATPTQNNRSFETADDKEALVQTLSEARLEAIQTLSSNLNIDSTENLVEHLQKVCIEQLDKIFTPDSQHFQGTAKQQAIADCQKLAKLIYLLEQNKHEDLHLYQSAYLPHQNTNWLGLALPLKELSKEWKTDENELSNTWPVLIGKIELQKAKLNPNNETHTHMNNYYSG